MMIINLFYKENSTNYKMKLVKMLNIKIFLAFKFKEI